jgi:C1A family cysteine protease
MNFCVASAILGINLCENDTPISAVEQSFIGHMAEQGLSYATEEEYSFRLGVFQSKDYELETINANPENTFTVGHNFLSTMTEEEIKRFKGGIEEEDNREITVHSEDNLLESVDWRSKMNAIKNQGQCGSCWAFSSVQTIESHHTIKTGQKVILSEQQLVDCSYGRDGCNGGNSAHSFDWAKANSGQAMAKASDYGYTGRYGSCN